MFNQKLREKSTNMLLENVSKITSTSTWSKAGWLYKGFWDYETDILAKKTRQR